MCGLQGNSFISLRRSVNKCEKPAALASLVAFALDKGGKWERERGIERLERGATKTLETGVKKG